jgi:hypothetical protein
VPSADHGPDNELNLRQAIKVNGDVASFAPLKQLIHEKGVTCTQHKKDPHWGGDCTKLNNGQPGWGGE